MIKLYVGNLPWTATEEEIRQHFSTVKLDKVTICVDRETGRARGFGFIELEGNPAKSQEIIAEYDGMMMGGRNLKVDVATEKPRAGGGPGPRPARGGGGRRGRGSGRRGDSDSDYNE